MGWLRQWHDTVDRSERQSDYKLGWSELPCYKMVVGDGYVYSMATDGGIYNWLIVEERG